MQLNYLSQFLYCKWNSKRHVDRFLWSPDAKLFHVLGHLWLSPFWRVKVLEVFARDLDILKVDGCVSHGIEYTRPPPVKFRVWSCCFQFSSVQPLSHVRLLATPWIAACQASLSITNSRSSLRLASIESVMPSSHLILGRPLFLLRSIPPSIRVFSSESALHMRWPKYWSFSFSIISSKEIPGLISFRMGWLDILAVQGTLKSLLQHHSSKSSILWCSAFFTVQLSHPYMTTGKTIALTRWP